jgi:hypothetical protein
MKTVFAVGILLLGASFADAASGASIGPAPRLSHPDLRGSS